MRVLLLDEEVGLGGLVESDLVDAGHDVVRCHPWGQPAFPCTGLVDRGRCPLEVEPVDVAVKVDGATNHCPGHHEPGVVCALRDRVPLVLAGSPPAPGLVKVAAAITPGHEDVVRVAERTAVADIVELARPARAAALQVLERRGLPHVDVTARVVRRGQGARRARLPRGRCPHHQRVVRLRALSHSDSRLRRERGRAVARPPTSAGPVTRHP